MRPRISSEPGGAAGAAPRGRLASEPGGRGRPQRRRVPLAVWTSMVLLGSMAAVVWMVGTHRLSRLQRHMHAAPLLHDIKDSGLAHAGQQQQAAGAEQLAKQQEQQQTQERQQQAQDQGQGEAAQEQPQGMEQQAQQQPAQQHTNHPPDHLLQQRQQLEQMRDQLRHGRGRPSPSPQPVAAAGAAAAAGDAAAAGSSSGSSSSSSSSPGGAADADAVAALHARMDPAYLARLKAAAAKPITIVVMTGLFWQLPVDHTKGCKVDGIPLDCTIMQNTNPADVKRADCLYYHVPSFGGRPAPKAFPEQLRLAMSLESAGYYKSLDDPHFMCHFDAEMTYRTCAQVTNWYSLEAFQYLFKLPVVPFEEKLHAIAYINSNCGAQSGRSDIMRTLIHLGDKAKVPVHSMGGCDRNKPWPDGNPSKIEVFSKYKFCVTMENSLVYDYITEKMWDGLRAGCVPVYLGSASALNIIPDPGSVIMYDVGGKGNVSTPQQLDELMHAIGSDRARYEAMLAWKRRAPEDQPSPLFRYLWSVQHTTGECFLCQFLARHRADPKPRYTTCLFNETWMAAAGKTAYRESQACPDLAKQQAQ